ncbi:MAG TPA: fumarylacetoacetate hydrolase family protein [Hyphomicrobiaceae bacterium]|jgi:2-keto-4-pentenoate hydratase/2-oxohepta-3-ene-1,7-dioic acid hydratase in catechol pathway
MKLTMFEKGGGAALGVVEGTNVIDLAAADASLPKDLAALIAAGPAALGSVKAAAAKAPASAKLPVASVKAALPIARPPKFICVGLNYALHAKEGGHPIPTYPSFFLRVATSLTAPGAPVIRPKVSIQLDYECELAIVIGKGGRHIPEADALDHVFGYTLFNDVSVRDFQRKTTQWTPGKNFDSTGPLGPWIVTADELPPGASGLRIQTRVNGEVMQDSNTSDMIFSTASIVATLSEFMTLEPGDIIATGTPSGVAHARTPPAWMKAGDRVEVELEGMGVLSNPIVDEA